MLVQIGKNFDKSKVWNQIWSPLLISNLGGCHVHNDLWQMEVPQMMFVQSVIPQDFENLNSVNPNVPAIIIYYIAPGSQPRQGAENRMEIPSYSVPVVALALKFPRKEGTEEEYHRVVSVKGI